MSQWTETIKDLEIRADELEKKAADFRQAIGIIRKILENRPETQPIKFKDPKSKIISDKSGHSNQLRRGSKNPSSQYRGVSKGRTKKDGTKTFRANPYKDGEIHRLGTFKIEEEAAAAVQEFLGNHNEAKRLKEIAEQKKADMTKQTENNPDKSPTPRGRKKKQQAGDEPDDPETAWECNGCHVQWQTKPKSCPGCGGSSFSEVNPNDI